MHARHKVIFLWGGQNQTIYGLKWSGSKVKVDRNLQPEAQIDQPDKRVPIPVRVIMFSFLSKAPAAWSEMNKGQNWCAVSCEAIWRVSNHMRTIGTIRCLTKTSEWTPFQVAHPPPTLRHLPSDCLPTLLLGRSPLAQRTSRLWNLCCTALCNIPEVWRVLLQQSWVHNQGPTILLRRNTRRPILQWTDNMGGWSVVWSDSPSCLLKQTHGWVRVGGGDL